MKSKISLIAFFILITSCSIQYKTSESFKMNFNDVDNFWKVYDKTNLENSDDERIKIIEEEYFGQASNGLKILIKLDKLTPSSFNNFIKDTLFFNSIRETTLKIKEDSSKIRNHIKSVEKLYPKARFSDVYFVIGQNFHGGTVRNGKMIIEVQKNAKTEKTKSEIIYNNGFKGMNDYNSLIPLVIHEQIHILQKKGNSNELLSAAISEGGADFVMFLVTNQFPSFIRTTYEYGEKNEFKLWKKFQQDLEKDYNSIRKDWFYNYRRKDIHPDLGYFIGFKICEKFYNESTNKKEALEFLLNIANSKELLEKSKYNGGK